MSDATVAKKPRETDDVPVPPTLRKSLKNRHIQLIALGGAIGTGLFYGSSESIQLAGPAILLAYLIGGRRRARSAITPRSTGRREPALFPAGITGSTTCSWPWWSWPWLARS